jgi:hypothetical protein
MALDRMPHRPTETYVGDPEHCREMDDSPDDPGVANAWDSSGERRAFGGEPSPPSTPPGGGIEHSEQKWPMYSTSSSSESSDTKSFATIELESRDEVNPVAKEESSFFFFYSVETDRWPESQIDEFGSPDRRQINALSQT